jgi:hypothetical protein
LAQDISSGECKATLPPRPCALCRSWTPFPFIKLRW